MAQAGREQRVAGQVAPLVEPGGEPLADRRSGRHEVRQDEDQKGADILAPATDHVAARRQAMRPMCNGAADGCLFSAQLVPS